MIQNLIGRIVLKSQGVSLARIEREDGQTLAEYALILAGIAVAVAAVVVLLGGQIGDLFSSIGSNI